MRLKLVRPKLIAMNQLEKLQKSALVAILKLLSKVAAIDNLSLCKLAADKLNFEDESK